MEPGRNRNLLHVALGEFKLATKVFTRKRQFLGRVLMAYEGGFLSFESGSVTAVMRAEGEWQGRASFAPEVLRALSAVPPNMSRVPIAYAEGHLLVGGLTISCDWWLPRQHLAQHIAKPCMLDLLAIGRTMPRAEIQGTDLGRRVQESVQEANRRIRTAARQLIELGVSENDIYAMVDARIAARTGEAGKSRASP